MNGLERSMRWRGLEDLQPELRVFLKRRCRDASEVDDVVQETLLRAARYRGSLSHPHRLRGWAMRIAINVLRDRVRREARIARHETTDEALEFAAGREPIPGEFEEALQLHVGEAVVERRAALAHLSTVLQDLRHDDRAVLRSYYHGAQSCAVTAHECGIPSSLVKVRLYRARQRLLRAIRQRLNRSDAWTSAAAQEKGELEHVGAGRDERSRR